MSAIRIRHARFTLSPFTSEQMAQIGNTVLDSVKKRIHAGQTVDEQAAKPLKPTVAVTKKGMPAADVPYAVQKQRRGLQGFRDLMKTGGLIASLQVLSASEDRCTIGSNNPIKDRILHLNDVWSPMFGMSKTDTLVMQQAVHQLLQSMIRVVVK